MAFRHRCYVLRRAFGHQFAATFTAFRAKIQHPIGSFDDFQIMFDHHHRIAGIHQRMQHFEQFAHIFEVQPSGRFIQDVKRAPGGAAR